MLLLGIEEVSSPIITRGGKEGNALLGRGFLQQGIPLLPLLLSRLIFERRLGCAPTIRNDVAQVMVESILDQLSKFRQAEDALSFSDGAGQHDDPCIRGKSVNDLHVQCCLLAPPWLIPIRVRHWFVERRDDLNFYRRQTELLVKHVDILL